VNIQRIVLIGCLTAISLLLLACSTEISQATPNLDATVQAAIDQTRTAEDAVATPAATTASAEAPADAAFFFAPCLLPTTRHTIVDRV